MALSTDLYSNLRKDILKGNLHQGEKLTEQQICDQYRVSRTPVREAFKQLELEGFIENIPNRGAFVIGLSSQDIEDLYELRKSYEILAVKWGHRTNHQRRNGTAGRSLRIYGVLYPKKGR